jgi:hypothetical protein
MFAVRGGPEPSRLTSPFQNPFCVVVAYLHDLWLSPKAEEGERARAATNLNRKLQRKWTIFFLVRIIIWSDFHLSEEAGEEEELGGLQIRMEAASSKRTIGIR